jgi:antitoxin (DNA-binding transcriptional repressor) of toxin-antitoxin stability system
MATYEIAEAEEELEALIEAAERGEEVLIARDGKAVARMTSMGKQNQVSKPTISSRRG